MENNEKDFSLQGMIKYVSFTKIHFVVTKRIFTARFLIPGKFHIEQCLKTIKTRRLQNLLLELAGFKMSYPENTTFFYDVFPDPSNVWSLLFKMSKFQFSSTCTQRTVFLLKYVLTVCILLSILISHLTTLIYNS